MHKDGNEIQIDEEDASGGRKTGRMRWILGIGLALAVIAMTLVWVIPALYL